MKLFKKIKDQCDINPEYADLFEETQWEANKRGIWILWIRFLNWIKWPGYDGK